MKEDAKYIGAHLLSRSRL